ncbi:MULTISPECIES: hypothetical protein [Cytobacillus]|uniref:hypothetical protein n=1 Tax=Cytobacillus TaxID=2675230 RepID=UPI00187EFD73|nr:hypothetical protein [Cytobacillus horneckiae]MEC1157695.1 hypothetical protein [Cytobacillus horneckiae]
MRDKKRISRILNVLQEIWEYQPDVRFNQLVNNLQYLYSEQNNGYGKRPMTIKDGIQDVSTHYLDFFYLEDNQWEEFLKNYLKEVEQEGLEQLTPSVINEFIQLFKEIGIDEDRLSNSLFGENLKAYLLKKNKGVQIDFILSVIRYSDHEKRRDFFTKIMNEQGE